MSDDTAIVWLGILLQRLAERSDFSIQEMEAVHHAIIVLNDRIRRCDNTRKEDNE